MRVEPGERVALLGPNGAGKTWLVLQLNGVLRHRPGVLIGSVVVGVAPDRGPQAGRRGLPGS